jgi:hypothetical protein
VTASASREIDAAAEKYGRSPHDLRLNPRDPFADLRSLSRIDRGGSLRFG